MIAFLLAMYLVPFIGSVLVWNVVGAALERTGL